MKYPKFVSKGDTIYLVAPSFGCTTEPYTTRMKHAINYFNNKGFRLIEGENIRSYFRGASNTKEKRAKEINEAFKSTASLVLSVGGGELMTEIADLVDFSLIKDNPKWFMGYSDNTILSYLIPTICDIASIYGPCLAEYGMKPIHQNQLDSIELFTGNKLSFQGCDMWEKESLASCENPTAGFNLTEKSILINYPAKNIELQGRLLGGCLDIILNIIGTPLDKTKDFIERYKEDKIIWFFDACDLNVLCIRRAMIQLRRAGYFKNTAGIVFGRPLMAMDEVMFDIDHYQAVYEPLMDLNIPIIFDAPIGHLKPFVPLICGAYANVSSIDNVFRITHILK